MDLNTEITLKDEQVLSLFFRVATWLRIGYGSLRILLGLTLLKFIGTPFTDLLIGLMSHEITEDPSDALFQFIYNLVNDHSFTVTYFLAIYLLFWGSVEVFLSIALLKRILWAYPLTILLIVIFVIYEMYRVFHTHSLILVLIIIVDLGIAYIIDREYRRLKKHLKPTQVGLHPEKI